MSGDGRAWARGVALRSSASLSRGRWPFRCRPGPVGRPLPRSGSSGRRTPMAASPASLRRRLERGDHGLGGAGAGERRPQSRSTCERAGHSPIAYLRSQARRRCARPATSSGRSWRLRGPASARAASAAATWWPSSARRRSARGSFEGQVNLTAFGILALRAAGAAASTLGRSAAWLREAQNGDGGWGFQPRVGSDPDSTGAALQALAAAGGGGGATRRGVTYLRRTQRGNGGFALAAGGPTNSQSTAWAIQGLVAAGVDPAAVRAHGRTPLDYLADQQAADGHYRYSSSSDQTPVWVTGQALLAVNRKAFPLAAVPRAPAGGRSAPQADPGSRTGASSGGAGSAVEWKSGDGHRAPGRKRRQLGRAGAARRPPRAGSPGELASGEPVSAPVAADAPVERSRRRRYDRLRGRWVRRPRRRADRRASSGTAAGFPESPRTGRAPVTHAPGYGCGDGRRHRDSHPAHPQGLPA